MDHVPGVYKDGRVQLGQDVSWDDGDPVVVFHIPQMAGSPVDLTNVGHVIIAGYGLAGRAVDNAFRQHDVPTVVIERNGNTVRTQRELGANIIEGDVRDEAILRQAGIENASVLALAIPDEQAVLTATQTARRLREDIYIVARTRYASVGIEAAKLGADEVIQAEYAVAVQFYQSFVRKLAEHAGSTAEGRQ